MAITSQHARSLRFTNGPYGLAAVLAGCQDQYRSVGAVACCTIAKAETASPIQAVPRATSRMPPRANAERADQNSTTIPAPTPSAHAVDTGSSESGRAGPDNGVEGVSSRVARSNAIAAGERTSRSGGGNGIS